ncbi:L,D-transpeptidase family protein [Rhizobium sp. SL42]|nr:L,D-transpeptidase family protein [Rhizobium sp. SL42]
MVRRAPTGRSQAILQAGPLRLRAAIGRSQTTSRKREGDGATPIATMKLISGYLRGDRVRETRTALPVRRALAHMLWCDAPEHASYNRAVNAPFRPSHERLVRDDELYDICIVMDWNLSARKRGCGSAIFFHIARPGYPPTEGCVALHPRDMRRLLPFLTARTSLQVL